MPADKRFCMSDTARIKIAYIGGGSRGWAPHLMSDLALSPHLSGEISLYDIDVEAARANVTVGRAIFGHKDALARFSVAAVERLDDALEGADFVVISIEPGPITMRYADLEIPRAFGIHQPVGDTTGPGGIMRALRTIPIFEGFAHGIMARCPKAWVINYTNPMTLCVSTLYAAEPAIKAFGCCHEVFGTQERLASLVAQWRSVPLPARREIELEIAGVNHFTFAASARWNGSDLFPDLTRMIGEPGFFSDHSSAARRRKKKEQWFESDGLIAFDLLRCFGVLGAAGDRHLAEFVPWYLQGEKELQRWGVVLTPYEWRARRMKTASRRAPGDPLTASGEEGVAQMHALLGFSRLVTNVNVPNRGQADWLPAGAVVESYAAFERESLSTMKAAALPQPLGSHVRHICQVQRATLESGLARDPDGAFRTLLEDPLVRIPTDRARAMFGKMLAYTKDYLPGWKL
jgi:alpha-galactosidase/6-phospho-beta-glucosidase family protein